MDESKTEVMTPEEKDRRLAAIETAIKEYQAASDNSYIEIGRRLLEVKQLRPHGGWISWVQTKTELSVCKAQRLIKVAAWVDGNEAPVPRLTFTQAYILSRLSPHDLKEFLGIFHLTKQLSGKRMKLPIKILLEKGEMPKRELEEEVRDFLRKRNDNRPTDQVPQQAEAPSPPQDNLVARFDQVRADVQELAGLVENNSGEYTAFAKELCEVCQDIVQRLSPEDLADI